MTDPHGSGTAVPANGLADASGQGNHWTTNGIGAIDFVADSPENNFCTYNPLDAKGQDNTFSEGALKVVVAAQNTDEQTTATFGVSSGKWYWEHRLNSTGTSDAGYFKIGLRGTDGAGSAWTVRGTDGEIQDSSGATGSSSVSYTTNNVIGIYLDMDNKKWYVSVDGSLQNSANLTNGTGFLHSNLTGEVRPFILNASSGGTHTGQGNFGQDSTFSGLESAGGNADSNGQGDFHSSVHSGYLALCSANLPEPTIGPNSDTRSVNHFGTLTYTGNGTGSGSTNNIRSGDVSNGVGGEIDFKPDFTWIKSRSNAQNHNLFDSNRGAGIVLYSQLDYDEADTSAFFTSFEDKGFNLAQNGGDTNFNNYTYVAWNWKANGGTTSSNSNGSITSTVQANTDAGFSIVTWTGNATLNSSVGHGLNSAPEIYIIKNRDDNSTNWAVPTTVIDGTHDVGYLNLSNGYGAHGVTLPTSSIVYLSGANNQNGSGDKMLMYCFHSVEGFSKFATYEGNQDTDGTFVYTGFRPAWLMIKDADTSGYNWYMYDNTRLGYNPNSIYSLANGTAAAETNYSGDSVDFLSNGFKLRTLASGRGTNRSVTYLYLAFAETPFKFANAR
jgi:hypothetical protein